MKTISQLPGAFGTVVEGIDVRQLNDAGFRELGDLLFSNRILVVRGQALNNDEYVAFGRRWGKPIEFIAPTNTLATHPEMIVQSNAGKTAELMRNTAAHWHCDSSYEQLPATVTMLLGVLAPKSGGETLFADLVAPYETLPQAMKNRIGTLQVRHLPGRGKLAPGEIALTVDRMTPEINQVSLKFGTVTQPLVYRHPVTGRKSLYALGGSAFEVADLPPEEGEALLAELKAHATQAQFVQSYKLMPGEILLWDNFSVMHRATPIDYTDEPEARRLNYRISVKGVPDFMDHSALVA